MEGLDHSPPMHGIKLLQNSRNQGMGCSQKCRHRRPGYYRSVNKFLYPYLNWKLDTEFFRFFYSKAKLCRRKSALLCGKSGGVYARKDCGGCCLPSSTQRDAAVGNQLGRERRVGLLLRSLPKNLVMVCYILILAINFNAKLALKVTGIKNFWVLLLLALCLV